MKKKFKRKTKPKGSNLCKEISPISSISSPIFSSSNGNITLDIGYGAINIMSSINNLNKRMYKIDNIALNSLYGSRGFSKGFNTWGDMWEPEPLTKAQEAEATVHKTIREFDETISGINQQIYKLKGKNSRRQNHGFNGFKHNGFVSKKVNDKERERLHLVVKKTEAEKDEYYNEHLEFFI